MIVAGARPETERSNHVQGEARLTAGWRPEPIRRSKRWDEVWLAEKFQSSSVISGSPRDMFRHSVG